MACIIELDGAMKLVYYRGEKGFPYSSEYCVALRAGYMRMNAVSDILLTSSFYLLSNVFESCVLLFVDYIF